MWRAMSARPYVPGVIDELCSKGVLTTEFAPGVAIDKVMHLPQEERDYIGTARDQTKLCEWNVAHPPC